jgi:hypothetical protein
VDAVRLADLSAAGQLPTVHVPQAATRQWRGLIAYRARLRAIYERVHRGSRARRKVAIVAVARRLAVFAWAMLRDGTTWRPYRPAETPAQQPGWKTERVTGKIPLTAPASWKHAENGGNGERQRRMMNRERGTEER